MDQQENQALVEVSGERALVAIPRKEGYFARIASRYDFAGRILSIVLICFLFLFICFFSRAFSYESIYYFMKDAANIAAPRGDGDSIRYTYHEEDSAFTAYHGGLVRVSPVSVEIFSANGTRSFFGERSFRQPRVVASRKIVIAYDYAGTDFYVYNAYAEIHHGKTETPILGVFPADSGAFAILTTSEKALSAVLLFDSRFEVVQRFERAAATVSVALSKNGNTVALAGLSVENGQPKTEMNVYKIGEEQPFISFADTGARPIKAQFLSASHLLLITSKSAVFFEKDGEIRKNVSFEGKDPIALSITDRDGVALALKGAGAAESSEILLLDRKGKEILRKTTDFEVTDISLSGDAIYLLSKFDVYRMNELGNFSKIAVDTGAKQIFAADRTRVAVIFDAKTDIADFGRT